MAAPGRGARRAQLQPHVNEYRPMNALSKDLDPEDAVDFRALFVKLAEKRWWIIGSILCFTAVFTTAAFKITPIYRASVLMVPANVDRNGMSGTMNSAMGQLGGLASLAGIRVGGGDLGTEEALAVLRSRDFTGRFITDEQLMPVLFANKWDAANKKWRVATVEQPTLSGACKYFDRIRSVSQDRKTGLVALQIDWKDRDAAAAWANELVQRLNAEMRAREIAQVNVSLGYLEKELASTSVVEVRDAINRLIEAQVKQRMLANVTQEYAFRIVDKAIPPDNNDIVKPNKSFLFVMGPLAGLTAGAVLVLFSSAQVTSASRR